MSGKKRILVYTDNGQIGKEMKIHLGSRNGYRVDVIRSPGNVWNLRCYDLIVADLQSRSEDFITQVKEETQDCSVIAVSCRKEAKRFLQKAGATHFFCKGPGADLRKLASLAERCLT